MEAATRHTTVATDGVLLSYTLVGSGPTKVLCIPGMCTPGSMWAPQVAAFLAGGNVSMALVDNRGSGLSETPWAHALAWHGGYSTDQLARDAWSVAAAAGWTGAVHICGHSLGGMIAQRAAVQRPSAVASLCLLATHDGNAGGAGWFGWPPRLCLPGGVLRAVLAVVGGADVISTLLGLHYTQMFLDELVPDEQVAEGEADDRGGGVNSVAAASMAAAVAGVGSPALNATLVASTTGLASRPACPSHQRTGHTVSPPTPPPPRPTTAPPPLRPRREVYQRRYRRPGPSPPRPDGFWGHLAAVLTHGLAATEVTRLAAAGFPILVVAGSADEVVPLSAAAALATRLGGRLLVVPAAHFVADEAAVAVNDAMQRAWAVGEAWAARAPATGTGCGGGGVLRVMSSPALA
ncbi:hypothetical protein I4F81_000300 [Pyropia yezoensis]|uniref:Uncharacterized protein n=1 Tax=Pyropia yezoensis TaxID=2788 RepID=A0ACC3BIF7_PYRYE|nr:hypothetical protein I4F81_000300 [Neopyropia yezoensis]